MTVINEVMYCGIDDNQDIRTIVCCVAQEANTPHSEYIKRKDNDAFSCVRNFILLLPNQTIFVVQMPFTVSNPHSKF